MGTGAYKDLVAKIEKIQKQDEVARTVEVEAVIAQIHGGTQAERRRVNVKFSLY